MIMSSGEREFEIFTRMSTHSSHFLKAPKTCAASQFRGLLILDGSLASDCGGLSLCELRIDNQELHICVHLDRSAT